MEKIEEMFCFFCCYLTPLQVSMLTYELTRYSLCSGIYRHLIRLHSNFQKQCNFSFGWFQTRGRVLKYKPRKTLTKVFLAFAHRKIHYNFIKIRNFTSAHSIRCVRTKILSTWFFIWLPKLKPAAKVISKSNRKTQLFYKEQCLDLMLLDIQN